MEPETPLKDVLVLDVSSGIGGAYATKILVDGGAEVVKLELPSGDPLRRRSFTGAEIAPDDSGALFKYLSASKHSVVVGPSAAAGGGLVEALLGAANAIMWSEGSNVAEALELTPAALRHRAPRAVVAALSAFGLDGPWAGRPATPATLESWAGGPAWRGTPDRPPVLQGGEPAEWISGTYAALGTLMALFRRQEDGDSELLDVSMIESLALTQVMHPVTFLDIAGAPWRGARQVTVPEIHPTKDGYVGFMVVTGQQWLDFCALVEQPGWADDESLFNLGHRAERRSEMVSAINAWTSERTSAEVTELAALMRIPATPVASGKSSPELDHFAERNFFTQNPGGDFVQPDVPYTLSNGATRRPFEAAPLLGQHTEKYLKRAKAGDLEPLERTSRGPSEALPDPIKALRIADFTQFWAGGSIAHPASMLGADVIHVESPARPDGARFSNVRKPGEPSWWEYGPFFQSMATNKLDLTLDLDANRGRELAQDLVSHCDVMVENYTPRVCENWGMTYEVLSELRPDLIMIRAPAFGLSGPWRDRGGYAPVMEQASGLGYITGYPDDSPLSPFGPGDPIAGAHAAIAMFLALFYRRRTGRGMLLEVPMAGSAINIAAEAVVEYSAYGNLMERSGNRSPFAAPQGMYLSDDVLPDGTKDRWVMISVATDEQWKALAPVIGQPELANDAELENLDGRIAAHDRLDEILAAWCASRSREEIVNALWAAGVPVAEATLGHELGRVEQLRARGYLHPLDHPIHGPIEQIDYPIRFSRGPKHLIHRHAPLLGEHNVEILQGLMGLSDEELEELEASHVVGTVAKDQTWSV